jgi:hypothetical protein
MSASLVLEPGIPVHHVEAFRTKAAPFRKNFWNRIDAVADTVYGRILAIVILVMAAIGWLFYEKLAALGYVGIAGVLLFCILFLAPGTFKAKPATWNTDSLGRLLSGRFREWSMHYTLQTLVEKERANNPMVEFSVEYLFDKAEQDKSMFPANFVLWLYPDFGLDKKYAVLMCKDGEPYTHPGGPHDNL